MPKLNDTTASAVAKEEVRDFKALEPGPYEATLQAVEVKMAQNGKFPYWAWTFKLTDYPGKQWVNTSLSPDALWKLKETFTAFGVSPDTDTDELVGKSVILMLSQTVDPKGNLRNQVDRVLPIDSQDAINFDEAEAAWKA